MNSIVKCVTLRYVITCFTYPSSLCPKDLSVVVNFLYLAQLSQVHCKYLVRSISNATELLKSILLAPSSENFRSILVKFFSTHTIFQVDRIICVGSVAVRVNVVWCAFEMLFKVEKIIVQRVAIKFYFNADKRKFTRLTSEIPLRFPWPIYCRDLRLSGIYLPGLLVHFVFRLLSFDQSFFLPVTMVFDGTQTSSHGLP